MSGSTGFEASAILVEFGTADIKGGGTGDFALAWMTSAFLRST